MTDVVYGSCPWRLKLFRPSLHDIAGCVIHSSCGSFGVGTLGSRAGSLVCAMTERISTDDVRRIADLAFLHLEPHEVELFTGQLSAVLDHASAMGDLDLTGVEPMTRPLPLSNVMRGDQIGELLDRDDVLASAPAVEDGQFRVPPVLGDER